MAKIELDIDAEALANVVLRQLPKFLEFCRATHLEEQVLGPVKQQAAAVGYQMPGSNKIH
ncbi:TPA: hypothetical protein ACSPZQ_001241 [Aeromonas veronii]